MATMRYAYNKSGKEVDACELSIGYLRSDTYKCVYCGKDLHFVSESDRCKPFFRHHNDQSCVDTNSCYRQQKERDVSDIISNWKSTFHKQWQELFPKHCTEVKFGGKIADVCIDCNDEWQLVHDDKGLFSVPSSQKLFIEIQHSPMSKEEVKRRVSTYITNTSSLLWVIDISSCLFHIEHIIMLNSQHYRLRFPKDQPSCLRNLLNLYYEKWSCGVPWIMLDSKKHLFVIKKIPKPDCQFLEVYVITWREFIDSFQDMVDLTESTRVDVELSAAQFNYREYVVTLDDVSCQNEVDRVVSILEHTPFSEIQEYVLNIYGYVGYITKSSMIIYKMLNLWLEKYKKMYFAETIPFGKYEGTPIWRLPEHYVEWVTNNCNRIDHCLLQKLEELTCLSKSALYSYYKHDDFDNYKYIYEIFEEMTDQLDYFVLCKEI